MFVVGNPVIDTLVGRGLGPTPVAERRGVLVTAHRPTNVDDPERLSRLVARCSRGSPPRSGRSGFPVHPRTAARLDAAGLDCRAGPPQRDRLRARSTTTTCSASCAAAR